MKKDLLKIGDLSLPVMYITKSGDDPQHVLQTVSIALESGIKIIQYREKKHTRKIMCQTAFDIRKMTLQYDALLIINDFVDIALCVDADGVHLGQGDIHINDVKGLLKDKLIGISTHNITEAIDAQKNGADYIGFGCIFPTTTKDVLLIQGADAISHLKKAVNIPVVAVGGINHTNIKEVINKGADLAAISSAISDGNVSENIKTLAKALL